MTTTTLAPTQRAHRIGGPRGKRVAHRGPVVTLVTPTQDALERIRGEHRKRAASHGYIIKRSPIAPDSGWLRETLRRLITSLTESV